jgi:copper transport protein
MMWRVPGHVTALLPAAGQSSLSSPGVWFLALLRWLLFAGLSGALGGLAGRGLSRQYKGPPQAPLPSPWALRSSLLGLAAAAGLAVVAAGGGSLAAGLTHPSVHRLSSGASGVIAMLEVAAFAAAAALLRLRLAGLSVVPLLAVVAAEGVRAHPEGIIPAGGALLTYAHLLPAALWAGMLLYVLRAAVAWRSDPPAMRGLVRLYGNAAAWLFALVVTTGVVSALVLVPLGSLLTTAYGIAVIIKAGLVAVAAALAVAGRVWLRRQPAAGAGPARATKLECGTLALVLAVTGLLTALTPPAAPASPNPAAARAVTTARTAPGRCAPSRVPPAPRRQAARPRPGCPGAARPATG